MTYLIGLVLLFYLLNNVIVPSFAKIGQIKNQSTMLEPFTNLTVILNKTHGLNSLLKANLFTSFDEVEAKDIVACLKNKKGPPCYSQAKLLCSKRSSEKADVAG